jgi:hypothetical protein
MVMDSIQILYALEKERGLLEDFICLSEEQLLLLEDGDLIGFDRLLRRRSELMFELNAIESAVAAWIAHMQIDPVTPEVMNALRDVNDEIVRMANHVVEIDEKAHARLNVIKQQTDAELREIQKSRRMFHRLDEI